MAEAARVPFAAFVEELTERAIAHRILETRRTIATQTAYYAQGRESLEAVNAKRASAGLRPIGEEENGRIITRTMRSLHLEGMAADIVPLADNGRIPWTITEETAPLWLAIGEIGEANGLAWGGRWTPLDAYGLGWDAPHYQLIQREG